ncbi:methyltransferase C2A9.10 [Mucor ambiguus]|uniref:RNA methyltransferase n=1 Tax=Mucor ambiguus TaxID=91626 RepID=A0A0C9MIJ8_9FUNG|nr:methyltransferase C2A9.10 [Mucor ambiguus]
MKRTQTNDISKPPNKRPFRRPTTISIGGSDLQKTKRYLGAKTKGTIEFAEKQQSTPKTKKPFGRYEYGNYQGYYTSRRKQGKAKLDARLDLLDEELFENKHVLDIGCNSGNIAIALAKRYNVASMHGVDIDDSLISKANINLCVAYSLDHPTKPSPIDLSLRFNYFPQSMSNMFGMMPMSLPPIKHKETHRFPFNIHFETMDWAKTPTTKYNQYDTILALSITKWIQLHNGDKGLRSFFKKAYDSLAPGGTLVLEPQDFDTFQRRAKQIDPSKDVEQELKFRPEDYADFLINKLGFRERRDLGVPKGEIKGFERPIILYIK